MSFDASNRRHIRERQKETRAIAQDNRVILKSIMEDYNGRRWMHDKLQRSHIFTNPFSSDPLQMAFNCGQQNEALQDFYELITLCPDNYILMMKEAHERHLSADTRTRESTGPDAERERGNTAEAERIGVIAERTGTEAGFDPFEYLDREDRGEES